MWRDEAYLLDILIAARRVLEFRHGLTWDQFQQSHLHQHAIAKAPENLARQPEKSLRVPSRHTRRFPDAAHHH